MYKGKESACPMDYSPHGYQVVLMKVLFEPYSNGLITYYLCNKKELSFPSSVPPSFSHQAIARNSPLSTTAGAEQEQRWLPTGSS